MAIPEISKIYQIEISDIYNKEGIFFVDGIGNKLGFIPSSEPLQLYKNIVAKIISEIGEIKWQNKTALYAKNIGCPSPVFMKEK